MWSLHLDLTNLDIYPVLLLLLGFVVGIVSGLLGLGGGWLITPVLNIMGFPVAIAVGTGLTQMVGTSAFAMSRHRKRGNVSGRLGLALSLPVVCGVVGGRYLMETLTNLGIADLVVRVVYVLLLGSLGMSIMAESRGRTAETERRPLLARLPKLGPVFSATDHQEIAWYQIIAIGGLAGLASGMLGVGGGFILMPFLVYGAGLRTVRAIGTCLVPVLSGSVVGATFYLQAGQVELPAAFIILGGAIAGTYLGVRATAVIDGRIIRTIFAWILLLTALSVLLKQLGLGFASMVLVYGATIILMVVFAYLYGRGSLRRRAEQSR